MAESFNKQESTPSAAREKSKTWWRKARETFGALVMGGVTGSLAIVTLAMIGVTSPPALLLGAIAGKIFGYKYFKNDLKKQS